MNNPGLSPGEDLTGYEYYRAANQ